jgi:histidine triad (HIT) family protein
VTEETIFSKIIRRKIPVDVVYEDDQCMAFRDIDPQAPVHVLVVPKRALAGIQVANSDDQTLLGHLLVVATEVARLEGIADGGYRCVINAGANGGQTVDHLHLHVLGGRRMSWPPG